ncbi:MAG: hypothetical protein DMG98_15165 [Acidobacteria bacterium]|nr:MAG: hypothetical protein DMG98_15165 [Acidobacteriota bacterium]
MNANSITNPKLIFEPENVDQLLQGWLLHVHKGRDRHDLAARRCDRIRWWLGGSAAVLSAIVGTTIFAAVEKHLDNSSLTLKVLIISVGILAAILTGLSTFLNLAERTEKHRSAGVQYKKMVWELERILSQSAAQMTRDDPALTKIQQQLDDLEERAPVVPEKLYAQVEDDWKNRGVKFVPKASDLYRSEGSVLDRS